MTASSRRSQPIDPPLSHPLSSPAARAQSSECPLHSSSTPHSVLLPLSFKFHPPLRVLSLCSSSSSSASPPMLVAELRQSGWCPVCSCRVRGLFQQHLDGRRHRYLSAHPQLPSSAAELAPPTQPPAPSHTAATDTTSPPLSRSRPSPPARLPAVRTRPDPTPTSSTDSSIVGNLCSLCNVRISQERQPSEERRRTHLRGVQHRTRTSVQQKQWDGDRSISAMQADAARRGVTAHMALSQVAVAGRELLLEVGRTHSVDVMIRVTSPVWLDSIHIIPAVRLTGFSWKGPRVELLSGLYRCSASVTPSLADVSTSRTLIVCCFSGGLSIAIPVDVIVSPAGSAAAREVLKPSAVYVPKERVLPSAITARYSIIAGDRPTSSRGAMDLFVRPLQPFLIPSVVSGALTEPDLKQRLLAELAKPLTPLTHTQRFQQLLWLEEVQMHADIQMYLTADTHSSRPSSFSSAMPLSL